MEIPIYCLPPQYFFPFKFPNPYRIVGLFSIIYSPRNLTFVDMEVIFGVNSITK